MKTNFFHKQILSFVFVILLCSPLLAQQAWFTKNLFEHKDFVENVGQYDSVKLPHSQQIFFSANVDGLFYYFTKTGYTVYKKEIKAKPEGEEHDRTSLQTAREEEEKTISVVEKIHELRFENPSTTVEIKGKNKVFNYYSYSDVSDRKHLKSIKASAFTKLVYHNIYPEIDIEFTIPHDSSGIEYSFILHRGANADNIKISFPLDTKFNSVSVSQNITINSAFGKIIHHTPNAFALNTKQPIDCKFVKDKNGVGFKLVNLPKDEIVVIDPWVVTPNFGGGQNAFDVDYDNAGNVYVYGGLLAGGLYELLKYSPTGILIWTYTPSFSLAYYGDFAVDRNSNNIYITEGFNPGLGASVIKINSLATVLAVSTGNPSFIEMWRISYARCTNQAVIAGGGISSPTYQTCYLDTNLTSLSMVQYVPTTNCCHDVGLLALDNYGNCYQISNQRLTADGVFENQLVKLPLPSLTPTTYNVNSNHLFIETVHNSYYGFSIGNPIGYNGLTTSGTDVYSYDGYVVKKWDGPTGNQLIYKRISFPPMMDSSETNWGGLSADDCGNVFLGDNQTVRQYDASLTLVNTYTMPGVIYDVNISSGGKLYVCGQGFLAEVLPTGLITCNAGTLTTVVTPVNATCTVPGSASISITGGIPPFTILWNTSPPQTGTSITNVPPGTYTVQVTDASCFHTVTLDTFTILPSAGAFLSTPVITSGCPGTVNNGTITINNTGGVAPFTYAWSTGTSSSNTLINLAPGVYTVTVTDAAGCSNAFLSLVVSPPVALNYTVNGVIRCFGDTTSLSVIPSGGSPPFTVNWISPVVFTGNTLHGVGAGTYSGTITDAGGCSIPFSNNWTQPVLLTATSITSYNCSVPNSGVMTITVSGGTPLIQYAWTGLPSVITNVATGLSSGIYTVTITDGYQCQIVITDTVGVLGVVTVNSGSICAGQSMVLIAGGGTSYTWSAGAVPYAATDSALVAPATTTTFTVSTVIGPCTYSAFATVTVHTPPVISLNNYSGCSGAYTIPVTLSSSGGLACSYNWSTSDTTSSINVNPFNTMSYWVTATNSCGSVSDTSTVTVLISPLISFTANNTSGCEPLCVQFLDNTSQESGASWMWDFGDGQTSIVQHPNHCYPNAGDYAVTLLVTNSNTCADTMLNPNYIHVFPMPVADFVALPNIADIANPTISFIDHSSGAYSWLWNFGNIGTSTDSMPSYLFPDAGSYPVILTVTTNHGCVDSTLQYIQILQFTFYAPNTFTPNHDNVNDVFLPLGTGWNPSSFKLWIYDRWGMEIFFSENMNVGWDGRVNYSKDVSQMDVFVWKAKVSDNFGNNHKYIGSVTLLK